ncbi:hypothetical protein PYK79_39000 [Streptomyces sp. ID05-04B]|nr:MULTISPECIES: hypothetical protein [unclassified Streptomyces]MDX5568075.1 hypothetical protein [Streptomyces sp. ID05-04B]
MSRTVRARPPSGHAPRTGSREWTSSLERDVHTENVMIVDLVRNDPGASA